MAEDLYKTLGINKGASEVEIKKAYRKKAMEFHLLGLIMLNILGQKL